MAELVQKHTSVFASVGTGGSYYRYVVIGAKPGFCEQHGIVHAWADVPSLKLSNPPVRERYCQNCGKEQVLGEPKWEDKTE